MSNSKVFKSLKKPLLSEEVVGQLKESIAGGIFRPGDKLPTEQELVEQLQVSRATVRNALRDLQNLGLIFVRRGIHAGAYVSEPSSHPITESFKNLIQMGKVDFAHLIDTRLYLEPAVAYNAAIYRTTEDITRLQEPLDRAEILLKTSLKEARLATASFHFEVALVVRNPIIAFLTESITQVFAAALIEITEKKLQRKRIEKITSEHRSILEAIVKRKPEEAFDRAREHLLETYFMYSRILPGNYDSFIDKKIRALKTK